MSKPILVTGATGQQGGAVVKALLEKGLAVRAITRHPDGEKARALKAAGVEVVQGDYEHPDSLKAAGSGVSAAWVVSTPFDPSVGTEGEARQGVTAIDALKEAGVPHIAYSSVSDADKATGIPHFDSKFKVEEHLKASGVAYTITAPVYFSDNTTAVWNLAYLQRGILSFAMPRDHKLQVISVRDIGRLNAEILAEPAKYAGRRINYAGDEVSGNEQAAALTKASGKEFEFSETPIDAVRGMSEDLALMFEWFVKVGYSADIGGLKKEFPSVGFQSYEAWARDQDWAGLLGGVAK